MVKRLSGQLDFCRNHRHPVAQCRFQLLLKHKCNVQQNFDYFYTLTTNFLAHVAWKFLISDLTKHLVTHLSCRTYPLSALMFTINNAYMCTCCPFYLCCLPQLECIKYYLLQQPTIVFVHYVTKYFDFFSHQTIYVY